MMRIKIHTLVVASIAVSLLSGCRQGQTVPNPLSALTPAHVPPPATGSYNVPDQYYKGQARATSGNSVSNLAARESAVGSGVVQSSFVDRGQAFGDAPDGTAVRAPEAYNATDASLGNPPPPPRFSSQIQSDRLNGQESQPARASAPLNWQPPGSGF